MPISIRNQKAEQLARELAAESGETITQVITCSLEERLARLRGLSTAVDIMEEILNISKRCSAIPDPKMAILLFVLLKMAALWAGFDSYYLALLAIIFISFAGGCVEYVRYKIQKQA